MNKHPFISYLTKITFFSIGICFAVMLLWLFLSADYIRNAPYYISLCYLLSLCSWLFIYYAPKKSKLKFEQAFFITKTAKLIIYLSVFAVILIFHIEKNTKFAFAYIIIYILYLIFDSVTAVRIGKEDKNNNK